MTVATSAQVVAPALPRRLAAAAAAAGLLALAFAPFSLLAGWVALPAFACLVGAFRDLPRGRAALVGFASGMVFFLILLGWLRVLGPDAWILLCLLCAAFWAAAGALMPSLLARRWWVRDRAAAVGLHGGPPGADPVGRLPVGSAGVQPGGHGPGRVGGPRRPGTGDVRGRPRRDGAACRLGSPAVRAASAPALAPAVLLAVLALGGALAAWGGARAAPTDRTEQLAVVQGNVPRLGLDFNAQRRAVLDNHVAETEALAAEVAAGRQAAARGR